MLKRREVEALLASVRAMLGAIERGELAASASLVHRLEGAAAVLDVVLGQRSEHDLHSAFARKA